MQDWCAFDPRLGPTRPLLPSSLNRRPRPVLQLAHRPPRKTHLTPPASSPSTSRHHPSFTFFYGRGCQDTLSPIARRCPFDIRRPLPSVSKSLDSDLGSRTGTSRWRGNGLMRQHVEHREDDLVWGRRSGRLASQLVLVDPTTGTILLSGPRWAMASFGTPRGHSLRVGTPNDFFGSSQTMDTLPRTFLVP